MNILRKIELSECVVECIHVPSRVQALPVVFDEAENEK